MKKIWVRLLFAIPLATLASLIFTATARAQITPDRSLGAESSVVNPNAVIKGLPSTQIDGGATRGANLFHSFQEFNVQAGRGAYFSNPAGIQNILSRVTGSNVSNIFGKLGVLGNANLFFINPNGIIFGPSSSLDVNGSFFAITADSVVFPNGFEFSATNPQAPPLLTINIPIGLRFRDNPGSITNQSVAVDASNNIVGLQVPSGNTLALVGGDVNLSAGGGLTAAGGRIELGGLAAAGTVGLETNGNTFRLNFPSNSLFSNVTLADDARVAVRGNGGGDIAVNTNIFTATKGGRLVGGTEGTGSGGDTIVNSNQFNISDIGQSGLGAGIYQQVIANASGNAGNITVNTNSFNASSGAVVINDVLSGGMGNAGDIKITAGSVAINSGAEIIGSTSGKGNAGNVFISAKDSVSLDNGDIVSNVEAGGVGKSGDINISAASLSLTDGGQLQTGSSQASGTLPAGRGNAGNINIDVTGNVTISGVNQSGFPSEIFSNIDPGATGNGGNITISSGSLSLFDGGRLNANNAGQGNAGNVLVQAKGSVSLAGSNTTIFSNVEAGGVGNGGSINISAASLSLTDGAQLQTLVNAASGTLPAGRGNAGNINIDVTGNVTISGVNNGFPSEIFSNIDPGATGKGGNITISSGSLSLFDGGTLNASTIGQGNAGSVFISAKDLVSLDNGNIFSNVGSGAVGNGGSINISAASLSLTDGAVLVTAVFGASDPLPAGRGNAGNVNIDVTGNVTISGVNNGLNSGIVSFVETGVTGHGGNITISSGSLSLSDGGQLSASTFGNGDAGSVFISAKDLVSLAGSNTAIFSNVEAGGVGNGGSINISAASLSLTDGAQLQTLVNAASDPLPAGRGNAGNVNIDVIGNVTISGVNNGHNSEIFSRVDTGGMGNGGNITISSGSLSLSDGGRLNASTFGQGNAGSVFISAKGSVSLAGSNTDIFSEVGSSGVGKGGDINIQAGSLSLSDGAQLVASTFGQGDAGNVFVQAKDSVSLAGLNTTIFSSVEAGGVGKGGNINIQAGSLSLSDGAQLLASTFGQGDAGNVFVQAKDSVSLAGFNTAIFSSVEAGGVGNGGDINISGASLSLKDGAQLITAVRQAANNQLPGRGNAGNVKVDVTGLVTIDGVNNGFPSGIRSFVDTGTIIGNGGNINISSGSLSLSNGAQLLASTFGKGNGGNIDITAGELLLRGHSTISTSASATGNGGNITITAPVIVAFPSNNDITANAFIGIGGNVKITTSGLFGIAPLSRAELEQRLNTTDPSLLDPGRLPTSDITAISQQNASLSGIVTINSPDVDPSRGLVKLPVNVTDPTTLIAQNPCQRGIDSSFTITGRGGLPSNPNQILASDNVRVDLVKPASSTSNSPTTSVKLQSLTPTVKRLVPAQGWIFNDKGQVILTAYDPTKTGPQRSWQEPASCAKR